MEWFLDLVLKLKPSSWSFEQVRHKKLLETLGDRRRRQPDVYDYEVVDMWHYGVPQTRTRLLAGPPSPEKSGWNFSWTRKPAAASMPTRPWVSSASRQR